MRRDWHHTPKWLALLWGVSSAGCTTLPSAWTKTDPHAPAAAQTTATPALPATQRSTDTGVARANLPRNSPSVEMPTAPPSTAGRGTGRAPPPEGPAAWSTSAPIPDGANQQTTQRPPSDPKTLADADVLEPARIVGLVGDQPILAGEIQGMVNVMLAVQLKDMPPEERQKAAAQIETFRTQLFKQALKAEVNTKLGYIDFLRTIPHDKHSELQKKVRSNFEREFEEIRNKWAAATTDEQRAELLQRSMLLARLAILMEVHQLDNLGQLDVVLRQEGSSLEKQVRAYGEQKLQQMSVFKNIRSNVEVTHQQMLDYYHEHQADFALPAKARWEQLTVRFERFPDEQAALAAISEMGNEVYLGGAPLAAVAKRSSQEPNADQGGTHDWTQRGSLASQPLDEAIFSLPPNRLSQVIRDERGLHILRVLERNDATHTPFLDAQADIKDKIRTQRRSQDIQSYFEKVRARTKVWTILDDEPQPAPGMPVSQASGG